MWLNCDLGEGMPYDAEIMPLIDMANLACGGHAGSPVLMRKNILLAQQHHVQIGAHPGYPDRENFGRHSTQLSPEVLEAEIQYQIAGLEGICRAHGTKLFYVKPHGALYNDMMRDPKIFETVVRAVVGYNRNLPLMILSSQQNVTYTKVAKRYGLGLIYELFADRNYTDEGLLVPRSEPDAVIHDVSQIVTRVRRYQEQGVWLSLRGASLDLRADTLCVHGDTPEALAVTRVLRDVL